MKRTHSNSWATGRLVLILMAAPLALVLIAATSPEPPRSASTPTSEAERPAGQVAFESLKCSLCHAVSNRGIERRSKSEKMHGSDLAGIGEGFDREFAEAYIRREQTLEGEKHKKPFKGTDEELQVILDWLATL